MDEWLTKEVMAMYEGAQTVKGKKEMDLYSAFIEVPYTQMRSGTDHTVLPANYTVPASTS